ncbi:MAG TPA: LuxR C-terminal-related transcriptional regulator [Mycobacteriales bacterium]
MAAMTSLGRRDLRALAAVIQDGLRDDPGQAMPWAVLDGLLQLIPCQHVGFSELDLLKRQPVILQHVEQGGARGMACGFASAQQPPYPDFWSHRRQFRPNRYMEQTGDVATVLLWSDFYTGPALKNAPYYAEYARPQGVRHGLYVPLPAGPGRRRHLSFDRDSGPDFDDDDRVVLQLLRPHLHEVYLEAERRRHGIPKLTRREHQVLRLAAEGHSNAEIARQLKVSVATVRKHLEHIFDRTGVRSRTAAATLVMPAGPRRIAQGSHPDSPAGGQEFNVPKDS